MKRYAISGSAHIEQWLATTTEPDRRLALLVWIKAASIDPGAVTNALSHPEGRGRTLHISWLEDHRIAVTFYVVESPVRALIIKSIKDTD